MLLVAILEVLSIGSIFPLLNFLLLDTNFQNYPHSKFEIIYNKFDADNLLLIILGIIFIIFLMKNFFLYFYTKFASAYMMHLAVDLQRRTFQKYLNKNYEVLRTFDSSKILRDINIESKFVIGQFISPLLTLALNFCILVFITMLLLTFNFKFTIFLILFFLSIFFCFKFILSGRVTELGKQRIVYQKDILRSIRQTFDGFREFFTYNSESLFFNDFVNKSIKLANNSMRRSIFKSLPRLIIETIVIFFIVLSIIFLNNSGLDNKEIFFSISVYTIAGLRLFPMIVAIINAYQNLNYSSPSMNLISELLNDHRDLKDANLREINFKNSIDINNISYSYNEKSIIKNFNLIIPKNFFLGVTGPSGCGKSTLVDLISGLIKPNKGKILVDGNDIHQSLTFWRKEIAYIQQKTYVFNDTIKKNIILDETKNFDQKKFDFAVKFSGLNDFLEKLDQKLDYVLDEFGKNISSGQLQRIGIARAIYKDPKLLIIDEGLSNLDENTKMKILDRLKEIKREKNIIFISHDLLDLENCDKIITL